jgi:hypothetical protein
VLETNICGICQRWKRKIGVEESEEGTEAHRSLYSDSEPIVYQECDKNNLSEHSASSGPEGMVQTFNVHSFHKEGEIAVNCRRNSFNSDITWK